ncbi:MULTISPECIES: PA0061/PA0062 family lipoprotein [Pseudomonas]|jgi:hypothetical protein|uniref:Lipoprotein n=1 Tax=Serpens gallinarum TaxID=2763075 RepID=A0ABR8TM92_9PSED|nr:MULTISPECIES: hypothetical protein [Pseudomonas]MBD7976759.1 hypothetical protein [Serpens gallinarum]MBF0676799.1 hypothetical protein [Pseudomonas sp.]
MRIALWCVCLCSSLGGCSLWLPSPHPDRAWIDLQTQANNRLLAVEVDGEQLRDRRYFQIEPGAHELAVRYHFEVKPTNIGAVEQPHRRDCRLTLAYNDFAPGQRYRLQAGKHGFRPWIRLYDPYDQLLARGLERGCLSI